MYAMLAVVPSFYTVNVFGFIVEVPIRLPKEAVASELTGTS